MTIFEFMSERQFLSFLLFFMLMLTISSVWKYTTRHLNIRKHGWPPEHCDADGDFPSNEED